MSFFDAMNIAASGLTAERTQMDVTSENLANAQTAAGANGQPYQPQAVELQSIGSSSFTSELASAMGTGASDSTPGSTPGGVQVTGIVSEDVPPQLVYDPGNPEANKAGYVRMPNIQPVTEMTNLITESNSYQADVTAMQTAKSMYSDTLDLLK